MASKQDYRNLRVVSDEEFLRAYNDTENFPTLADVDRHFGRTMGFSKDKAYAIRRKYSQTDVGVGRGNLKVNAPAQQIRKPLEVSLDALDSVEEVLSGDKKVIHRLSQENKFLKRALEEAKGKVFGSEDIREIIGGVKEVGFDTIPKWVEKTSTVNDSLVPVIILTDIHIGEVVNGDETGFGDDYNTELCFEYTNQVVDDFIDISCNKMSNYSYKGCVLMVLGDVITNDIHGLNESNDTTPVRQVIDATSLLIQQIKKLEKAFGKVCVACTTGNHGRLDIRHSGAKTKLRTETSLETLVYHFTHQHFMDNPNVSVVYNEADEILLGINGRRFNLQHGDRIRASGSLGGIAPALARTRAKLLNNAVANGRDFDTLVVGHFHTHHISDEIIVGAAMKPYDEYCKANAFTYNEPGGTSFFVNARGDIIYATHLKVRLKKPSKLKDKSIELF